MGTKSLTDWWDEPVLYLLLIGILARIGFWSVTFPNWKLYTVFELMDSNLIHYISDFTGYKPLRMPFPEVFAAAFYIPTQGILGIRGLSVFSLLIGIISLPIFFITVKRLLSYDIALYSLVFFALYPKLVVLTATGVPESASVSFIVFTLYFITRGEQNGDHWYLLAGLSALLSFYLSIPSVIFALVVSLYLYFQNDMRREIVGINLIPSKGLWLYLIPPFIGGTLYLIFSPAFWVSSGNLPSLFISSSYSFFEKAFRSIVYIHSDFWWHFLGFDTESGFILMMRLFRQATGALFQPILIGWLGMTAILSIIAFVGFVQLIISRSEKSILFITWTLAYVGIYLYLNWGWTGSFRTYHIFQIVPVVAIMFGIGISWIYTNYLSAIFNLLTRKPSVRFDIIILMIIFISLFAGALGHGYINSQNEKAWKVEPVNHLETLDVNSSEVAVTPGNRGYFHIVQHTQGRIQPQILREPKTRQNLTQRQSLREKSKHYKFVSPNNISKTGIKYVIVFGPCQPLSDLDQKYLNAAINDGGRIIYRSSNTSTCNSRTLILKLP